MISGYPLPTGNSEEPVKDYVIENAMGFCYSSFEYGFVHYCGIYFTRISDWFTKDPHSKADLCKEARDLMLNENTNEDIDSRCRDFRNRNNC
ncbi:MAG: hypothetical protein QHH00_08465 [Methanomassiliicoccales archaeon]|nr:hypothetical protein [Methanomassiliicoccales archaeon]